MTEVRRLLALVRGAVLFELRLYKSLVLWVVRRPAVPPSGSGFQPWSYAEEVAPVMWLWIFASAMEVPLVHVLIPWDSVRLVALVLSIWGLVWMVGMLQPEETERGTHLRVAVSGKVNVHLTLETPLTVQLPKGPREVVELSFWVDDPRALVTRARQSVAESRLP